MAQYFDAYQYLQYVFSRLRFILVTVVTGLVIALVVSLIQPKTYTATARVVIDPPGGGDPRVFMAISPVYLELLRTYELVASSDDLFLRVVKKFDLDQSVSFERLKKSVLDVEMPKNTKILEINARVHDARKAHDIALYVAQETVSVTRGTSVAADEELTVAAEKQLLEARTRVANANRASREMGTRESVEGFKGRIESFERLRASLEQELLAARLNIADSESREKALAQDGQNTGQLVVTRDQLRSDRLRAGGLGGQIAAVDREIETTRELLAARSSRQDELAAERKSAQAGLDATENRLREARAYVGLRGERLRIIDPGVVPARPSSPNIPLNIAAALLMSLILAVLLVSIEFNYRLYKAEALRLELRSGRVNG